MTVESVLTERSTRAGSARPRSHAIDALRGAAIVTMFAANLAGPCLRPPHPMWLRIYGSFAAPTFVLLAFYEITVTQRCAAHPYPARRAVTRPGDHRNLHATH